MRFVPGLQAQEHLLLQLGRRKGNKLNKRMRRRRRRKRWWLGEAAVRAASADLSDNEKSWSGCITKHLLCEMARRELPKRHP